MDATDKLHVMRQNIETTKVCFEQIAEGMVQIAKMYRVYFEALVNEGFTESQALELIKARGVGA